jgi:hypothetical protein
VKNVYYILISILISAPYLSAQPISPLFFGQNAWMPDSIGNKRYWGQLHNKWNDIQQSGAAVIRFGGIAPDQEKPNNFQYLRMIDSIRNKGMEPILQVPYYNGKYSAAEAAEIVRFINIEKKKNIQYWIIGNEPDHVYKLNHSSQVAPYIRAFSFAMKDKDPSIKIIGPETAWYNSSIINGLTTPGGTDDITGKDSKGRFITDIISFHTYPFDGTQKREDVISHLMSPHRFNDNLKSLSARIRSCNNHHNRIGSQELKISVTEANINYRNIESDNLNGNGVNSFIGGQFWAEVIGIALSHEVEFINFWSVIEGNNNSLNIGYIDKFSGKKQPVYHHFKLLADNINGNFSLGTSNNNLVKTFGSKDSSVVCVMVMNQSNSNNYNYILNLNKSLPATSHTIKLTTDANINASYTDHIQNQSSVMLLFDHKGNLLKKCEYRLNGHADKDLPPECILYAPQAAISPAGSTEICYGDSVFLTTAPISGYQYQWFFNNTGIPGETNHSHYAKQTGIYKLRINSAGGTAFSNEISVNTIPIISSVPEIKIIGNDNFCFDTIIILSADTATGHQYEWYFNNQAMNNSDSNAIYAYQPGYYQVKLFNQCNDLFSETVYLAECLITDVGTERPDSLEWVKFYPNPSTGTINLDIMPKPGASSLFKLQVFDLDGKLILDHDLFGKKPFSHALILDDLAKGVYFLHIINGKNRFTGKILLHDE